jgi:3-deoxy-D-manno-octulosonate 8-phosphate phosphatase KdsC-like HAD superfamily phosphatase
MTGGPDNEALAKDRGISCFVSRDKFNRINKAETFDRILAKYQLTALDPVWGVGDDLFDVPFLQKCSRSFCPADSPEYVRNVVTNVLTSKSGDKVIVELVENYLLPVTEADIREMIEVDRHEGWSCSSR